MIRTKICKLLDQKHCKIKNCRSSLLASTLPDTLGWLLMASTYLAPTNASLPLLLTGRALTGLASAGLTPFL